jgi:hypothetical protein
MDRQRVRLQLQLVNAVARAEGRRGNPERMAGVASRSAPILDDLAKEIRPEADPELGGLLADARASVAKLHAHSSLQGA